MKRMFAAILALCICLAGFAMAEETIDAIELVYGETAELDLNGDGAPESVMLEVEPGEGGWAETARLTVSGEAVWSAEWERVVGAYAADVDADGAYEIFVSGDEASDDFTTYCVRCTADGYATVPFADANRGENTGEYLDYGYGLVAGLTDGIVTLCGSQDVLGTYFGSRQFMLEDGRFEFADDGLWQFPRDFEDPELWDSYCVLTAATEIPVNFMTDSLDSAGVIAPGEKLVITASDKLTVAYFAMEDGRMGYFSIAPDAESWGSLVNGVPEDEVFEFVPYAD